MEKKLPIDEMSNAEYDRFVRDVLNRKYLDCPAKSCIKRAFGLHKDNTTAVRVNCDEAHAHNNRCLEFNNRYSEVVYRLLEEIQVYRDKLSDIKNVIDDVARERMVL